MLLPCQFEPHIRAICQEHGFAYLADKIVAHAQPALRMYTLKPDDYDNHMTGSRFGGEPCLPADIPWPTLEENNHPLDFILQINLAELTYVPVAEPLPKTGMLLVFADYRLQGYYGFPDMPRIIYTPEVCSETRALPYKDDKHYKAFPRRHICFHEVMTMYDVDRFQESSGITFNEAEDNFYDEYLNCVACDESMHLLLGLQTHDNVEDCSDFLGEEHKHANPVEHGWRMLLRIAWDEDVNEGWADGGHIYFYIHPDALAKADFSQVILGVFSY